MKELTKPIEGLDALVEKLLEDNLDSFTCPGRNGWELCFTQHLTGKAKYVYVKKKPASIYNDMTLFAIVAVERVFIINPYWIELPLLDKQGREGIPDVLRDKVMLFYDYVKSMNRIINDSAMDFINKHIAVPASLREEDERLAEKLSRGAILYGKSLDTVIQENLYSGIPVMGEQDVAEELCGIRDLISEAEEFFAGKCKGEWRLDRAIALKIQEYLSFPLKILSAEELRISDGLRKSAARYVTAKFVYDGKEASAKISPDIILSHICDRDNFRSYDFQTGRAGEQLMESLGCSDYPWDENGLTVEHIAEITYGKKTIYRKGEK